MRTIARFAAAAALALGSAWVPLETALACSCAFLGYPEAIGQADVAFVGTVVDEAEPGQAAGGLETARYAFEVSRAKAEMASSVEVDTIFGNGANCGFDMAVGEEWLIVATLQDGRPQTDLCQGSARTIDLDAQTRALLDEALDPVQATTAPQEEPISVPAPLLLAVGAAALVGIVSLFAFRREDR